MFQITKLKFPHLVQQSGIFSDRFQYLLL